MMDLKKIKKLLFKDIELVLSNLEMDYEIVGDNVFSTCPIHEGSDNKRAFSLSLEKQVWRCWTRDCQNEHGSDIFGLIRGVLSQRENKDVGFKGALRWACKILNIDSKTIDVEKKEEPSDFVKMVNLFSSTKKKQNDSFNEVKERYNLLHPSEYFTTRGFNEQTLLYFEVGDCLDKGSPMYQRAIIPIHSDNGSSVVGYIGRSTKDYRTPKFLFTKGINKSNFLYNYHRAINKAKDVSCLFITEGQGDVWKLYEAGVENAVRIFGKDLSARQSEKVLASGVTKLVILTDNDQAGRESKIQIQRRFSRMFKLYFPKMTRKDIGDMTASGIRDTILPQVRGTY